MLCAAGKPASTAGGGVSRGVAGYTSSDSSSLSQNPLKDSSLHLGTIMFDLPGTIMFDLPVPRHLIISQFPVTGNILVFIFFFFFFKK